MMENWKHAISEVHCLSRKSQQDNSYFKITTSMELKKTPRDGTEHREGEAEAQGAGERITQRHHPGLAGDWAAGRGRKGGERA